MRADQAWGSRSITLSGEAARRHDRDRRRPIAGRASRRRIDSRITDRFVRLENSRSRAGVRPGAVPGRGHRARLHNGEPADRGQRARSARFVIAICRRVRERTGLADACIGHRRRAAPSRVDRLMTAPSRGRRTARSGRWLRPKPRGSADPGAARWTGCATSEEQGSMIRQDTARSSERPRVERPRCSRMADHSPYLWQVVTRRSDSASIAPASCRAGRRCRSTRSWPSIGNGRQPACPSRTSCGVCAARSRKPRFSSRSPTSAAYGRSKTFVQALSRDRR